MFGAGGKAEILEAKHFGGWGSIGVDEIKGGGVDLEGKQVELWGGYS